MNIRPTEHSESGTKTLKRATLEGLPKCSRPRSSRTDEMIKQVRKLILKDAHLSTRDIGERFDVDLCDGLPNSN